MDRLMVLLQAAGDIKIRMRVIRKIRYEYDLDYRTIIGLNYLVTNRLITKREYLRFSNASYYNNLSHCTHLYYNGYERLIPTKYFQDEKFLEYTGIDYIPDYFNTFNEDIKSFIIRPNIRRIGKLAFAGCTSLERVVYEGYNLTYIDDLAFMNCTSLSEESKPQEPALMGEGVFAGCDDKRREEEEMEILLDMSALA